MAMQNRNILLNIILGIACILFLILALSLFRHSRKMEFDFNEKKGALIRENLDFKDRIESLEGMIKEKMAEAARLEEKGKAMEAKLKKIQQENEALKKEYNGLAAEKTKITEQADALKKKYIALSRKVADLKSNPLVKKIQESIDKEQNSEIKKVLLVALQNIELIQSGKSVALAPIVVSGKEKEPFSSRPESPFERTGQVLSVDKKNNLVVIDLGRQDKAKKDETCIVFKDDKELARGQIISVRYKIAAVFINEVSYGAAVNEIEEGDKVLIINE